LDPAAILSLIALGEVFMPRESAGLLMYRIRHGSIEVLLIHPGGPFFLNKDEGAWSIPKGEIEEGEELLEAARREFLEEISAVTPTGPFLPLKAVRQKSGKIVHAWAFVGDCDPADVVSNTFTMEWPRGSGRMREFREVDRAEFFDLATARKKVNPAQVPFLDELETFVKKAG